MAEHPLRDAAEVALPVGADVVVAEIIETGLLDEQQVPVLNALRRRGSSPLGPG
jgi:predicted RNA methylase